MRPHRFTTQATTRREGGLRGAELGSTSVNLEPDRTVIRELAVLAPFGMQTAQPRGCLSLSVLVWIGVSDPLAHSRPFPCHWTLVGTAAGALSGALASFCLRLPMQGAVKRDSFLGLLGLIVGMASLRENESGQSA